MLDIDKRGKGRSCGVIPFTGCRFTTRVLRRCDDFEI
jgi:hypothetical protein